MATDMHILIALSLLLYIYPSSAFRLLHFYRSHPNKKFVHSLHKEKWGPVCFLVSTCSGFGWGISTLRDYYIKYQSVCPGPPTWVLKGGATLVCRGRVDGPNSDDWTVDRHSIILQYTYSNPFTHKPKSSQDDFPCVPFFEDNLQGILIFSLKFSFHVFFTYLTFQKSLVFLLNPLIIFYQWNCSYWL